MNVDSGLVQGLICIDFHLSAQEVKFLLIRVCVKVSPPEPRGENRCRLVEVIYKPVTLHHQARDQLYCNTIFLTESGNSAPYKMVTYDTAPPSNDAVFCV